jgi:hypothetical protein
MLTKSQDARNSLSPLDSVGRPDATTAEVSIVSAREEGTLFTQREGEKTELSGQGVAVGAVLLTHLSRIET